MLMLLMEVLAELFMLVFLCGSVLDQKVRARESESEQEKDTGALAVCGDVSWLWIGQVVEKGGAR